MQLTHTVKKNSKNCSRQRWDGSEQEATLLIHVPMKMQTIHLRQRKCLLGTLSVYAVYYFSVCDQWISWGSMQYVRYQKMTYKVANLPYLVVISSICGSHLLTADFFKSKILHIAGIRYPFIFSLICHCHHHLLLTSKPVAWFSHCFECSFSAVSRNFLAISHFCILITSILSL